MSETVKDMTDEELLAQINCHDPYDVEFTKRFQSLTKERDALQARVAELEGALIAVEDEYDMQPYGPVLHSMNKVRAARQALKENQDD